MLATTQSDDVMPAVAAQKMLNEILFLNEYLTLLNECKLVNTYTKLLNGLILKVNYFNTHKLINLKRELLFSGWECRLCM